MSRRAGGFTLLEVLVALVIVAFGMGAVLSALSAAAFNVNALRDKTLAQWIALNKIADARLNLQIPNNGTSEGDIKNFGNGDWHWQQDVTALTQIPGLLQITVSVRRTVLAAPGSKTPSSTVAPSWLATVVGFRGSGLAPGSGEVPDWTGTAFGSSAEVPNGGTASGSVANPGTTMPTTTPVTPTNPAGSTGLTPGIP
jgi:general secretion pathway protein I